MMKARAEVITGDCLVEMPRLIERGVTVDACITDPPYSEHVHSKHRVGSTLPDIVSNQACFNRAKELGFDALTLEVMKASAELIAKIVLKWTLVFSDVESCGDWRSALVGAGLEYVRTGAWQKLNATPQFTGDRPAVAFEAITIAHHTGRKSWNGGGSHGLWAHPIVINRSHNQPRFHTTQKPVSLMRELVTLFSNEGDTIIDPFCGSGSTGVACMIENRNFIGIEKDESYAVIARARISRAQGIACDIPKRERPHKPTPLFDEQVA